MKVLLNISVLLTALLRGPRTEVRKNIERELKNAVCNRVKTQVIDGLLNANDIHVPVALLNGEIDVLKRQAVQCFAGNKKKVLELPGALFEAQAKRRVKVGLLLGEVIRKHKLKVDEALVSKLVKEMASAYEDPKGVIESYSKSKKLMEKMRNLAMEEEAVEVLLKKCSCDKKRKQLQ